MSRSRHRDTLRRHAPRCCRTGKSSRHVRGGSGACSGMCSLSGCRDRSALRSAESTSGSAFDNALRRLEPGGKSFGPCFVPPFRDRCEASFVTVALEAQPSFTVFARHFHRSVEWVLPSLWRMPSVGKARCIGSTSRSASIGLPSFRGRRRHQPDLPPLPTRVDKGPIAHAVSSQTPTVTADRAFCRYPGDRS
jgi:hypothetical protein